jgi:hypothetical protein
MRSKVIVGLSVAATAFLAVSAQALPLLPVQNLTFSTYSGSAPKNNFSTVNPANWQRGAPAGSGDLVFIDAPGTATSATGGYPVYGPFANPPPGGNFVQADGNPDFESTFFQVITGLTPGQTYELSFWQAAGQQTTFHGATTEQWIVSLGTSGLAVNFTGSGASRTGHYSNADGTASTVATHLMNTPDGGVYNWEQVTIDLVADSTSDILSFLAWGNGGSTVNQPPTVFLAGVNTPAKLPEPMTLSLFSAGLAGLALRRRAQKKTKA